jgi:hypothetical protein
VKRNGKDSKKKGNSTGKQKRVKTRNKKRCKKDTKLENLKRNSGVKTNNGELVEHNEL